MRCGIFLDLRNPPGWARPWPEVFSATLDRIALAESAGLDSVWLSEHHGCEDGYQPQPLTFLAAVASRSKRLRLGTGILLAPLRHPVDIAEQAAIVDILSEGRLELGLGSGYRRPDFELYEVPYKDRTRLLEQRVTEIRRLWDEEIVVPPPVQKPVPVWLGGNSPMGARRAGRLGANLLWLEPSLLDPYLMGLGESNLPASRARMGGLVNLILSRDPDRTMAQIEPNLLYHATAYRRYAVEGTDRLDEVESQPITISQLKSDGPVSTSPFYDVVTPQEAERRLSAWLDGMPVSDVFFWDTIAQMPEEIAEEHIELLASIAPELRKLGLDPETLELRCS
jgi:alkanesulfonate monooxygenase SsuD/methylene tetrahydromethanopterin reductase-like flavin-dependent oxidoreductase (luciferase family)